MSVKRTALLLLGLGLAAPAARAQHTPTHRQGLRVRKTQPLPPPTPVPVPTRLAAVDCSSTLFTLGGAAATVAVHKDPSLAAGQKLKFIAVNKDGTKTTCKGNAAVQGKTDFSLRVDADVQYVMALPEPQASWDQEVWRLKSGKWPASVTIKAPPALAPAHRGLVVPGATSTCRDFVSAREDIWKGQVKHYYMHGADQASPEYVGPCPALRTVISAPSSPDQGPTAPAFKVTTQPGALSVDHVAMSTSNPDGTSLRPGDVITVTTTGSVHKPITAGALKWQAYEQGVTSFVASGNSNFFQCNNKGCDVTKPIALAFADHQGKYGTQYTLTFSLSLPKPQAGVSKSKHMRIVYWTEDQDHNPYDMSATLEFTLSPPAPPAPSPPAPPAPPTPPTPPAPAPASPTAEEAETADLFSRFWLALWGANGAN